MPMNTQFSQSVTAGNSGTAGDSPDSQKPRQRSVESARGLDAKDWTAEETLRVVNDLRAKWLRKLQLAERGDFRDQRVYYRPRQAHQDSSSASDPDNNMNSTITPTALETTNDEIARLKKELAEARVRVDVATERLDKAEHRLEGAATLIGCLCSRIQNRELETDRLEWQCDKSETLRREAETVNATLRIAAEALRETFTHETDTLNNNIRKALARVTELESSWWHQFKTWFLSPQRAKA